MCTLWAAMQTVCIRALTTQTAAMRTQSTWGRVIAGAVLQVYEKVQFCDVDCVRAAERIVNAPSNMPTAEEAARAEKIVELHNAGRDAELPFAGMELTTAVAEALRMKHLKDGPETFPLPLSGVRVGPVAFLGIPGEPFTGHRPGG